VNEGDGPAVVVLGGGGAKATAHVGAYRALLEAGIRPARLVGTSMGAVMAALFAAEVPPEEVFARIAAVGEDQFIRPERLAVVRGLWARALLKPEPFREALAQLLPARNFSELGIPLTVTAVDLDSGALHWLGWGGEEVPLLDALVATCALPVHFPPVVIGGRRLVDGGLRAVLPLEGALLGPVGQVIAVDTGPGFDQWPAGDEALPPLIATHDRSSSLLMAGQTAHALALWRSMPGRPPLLYIRPAVPRGATFSSAGIRQFAEEGYRATRAALAGLPSASGQANLPAQ
jgi:NTE family protein